MKTVKSLIAAGLFALLSAAAWADTTELTLTDDAWINANGPTTNFGTASDIFVHNWGPKYGLVRFDAAAIAGQGVDSATLTLYLSDIAAAGSISLRAITSSWSESTVTWSNQPPAEAVATAVHALTLADEASVVSIDVTSAVQRWADGSLADAGFLIVTTDGIKAYFDAKERAGGVPATLTVTSTASSEASVEAIVLDLSDPDDCVIDEPGFYVLDRSWYNSPYDGFDDAAIFGCAITIRADATLDLRGFFIHHGSYGGMYEPIVLVESGNVTIRNGALYGQSVALESLSGARVRVEHLRTGGSLLLKADSVVLNSTINGGSFEAAVQVRSNSVVEYTTVRGGSGTICLDASGSAVVLRNNIIVDCAEVPAVAIAASDSIVEHNLVEHPMLLIAGDRNIVSWNIVQSLVVDGNGNVLDGNIATTGDLEFTQSGNFYGNNRVAGSLTGTAGQTDWGGNVSY